MKIFALAAQGNQFLLGSLGKVLSHKAFTVRSEAESYIPEFRKKCTQPKDKYDIQYLRDDALLEIAVIELELNGE